MKSKTRHETKSEGAEEGKSNFFDDVVGFEENGIFNSYNTNL